MATASRADMYTAIRQITIGWHGRVLEVGAGYGRNFSALPAHVEWIGLEPSARYRRRLARAARSAGHAEPIDGVAEHLPIGDAQVDAVLATFVLCSVDDQAAALAEFSRVLVPGGAVLLAEHVGAATGTASRRLQGMARPFTKLFDHGCDPTRDTEQAVVASGLEVCSVERFELLALGRITVPALVMHAVRTA